MDVAGVLKSNPGEGECEFGDFFLRCFGCLVLLRPRFASSGENRCCCCCSRSLLRFGMRAGGGEGDRPPL